MFIPNAFKFENLADKIAFMKRYSFATMVTCKDKIPIATRLPFVIDYSSGKLLLNAHLAIIGYFFIIKFPPYRDGSLNLVSLSVSFLQSSS
ncbi:FMN-binding negative transcriptional regulator [Terrimonas pollutisoli]|uniref:FMN-binding negative transcriptional regulator n=1 Tax=Terrimonas pollutisoli TaxID=3034147 RepID=UPI0023EB9F42|nr:FMN-binding negative transcriptional regulator [Terrimonas sp. H1YJ31]